MASSTYSIWSAYFSFVRHKFNLVYDASIPTSNGCYLFIWVQYAFVQGTSITAMRIGHFISISNLNVVNKSSSPYVDLYNFIPVRTAVVKPRSSISSNWSCDLISIPSYQIFQVIFK